MRADVIYSDGKGNVVPKAQATWAEVIEYGDDGRIIQTAEGTVNGGKVKGGK